MSPTAAQSSPTLGVAPHSVDLVIADFTERKRYGVQKYGVAHQHDNGRDHLVDLYQELLDACVYVRAELERTKTVAKDLEAEHTAGYHNAPHRAKEGCSLCRVAMSRGEAAETRHQLERAYAERDRLREALNETRALVDESQQLALTAVEQSTAVLNERDAAERALEAERLENSRLRELLAEHSR